MAKKKTKSNFEEDLSRLEEISQILEEDGMQLEEAILLFEEGVKLSKSCLKTVRFKPDKTFIPDGTVSSENRSLSESY